MAKAVRDELAVYNERVKLFAGFLNAIGIGLIAIAVLRPMIEGPLSVALQSVWWGLGGLALHVLAHYFLGYLRKDRGDDAL